MFTADLLPFPYDFAFPAKLKGAPVLVLHSRGDAPQIRQYPHAVADPHTGLTAYSALGVVVVVNKSGRVEYGAEVTLGDPNQLLFHRGILVFSNGLIKLTGAFQRATPAENWSYVNSLSYCSP